MPWSLFWTSLLQIVIATVLLTIPATFTVFMLNYAARGGRTLGAAEASPQKII